MDHPINHSIWTPTVFDYTDLMFSMAPQGHVIVNGQGQPIDASLEHSGYTSTSTRSLIRMAGTELSGQHVGAGGLPPSINTLEIINDYRSGQTRTSEVVRAYHGPGTRTVEVHRAFGAGGYDIRSSSFGSSHYVEPEMSAPPPSNMGTRTGTSRMNENQYSRKVFVGGLPPDISGDDIGQQFAKFGPLVVDWPHKVETRSTFPPKGFCFLMFLLESSVPKLLDACFMDDQGKFKLRLASPSMQKSVQIIPWMHADAVRIDPTTTSQLEQRKTVFVGGVPRICTATELEIFMSQFGKVLYTIIDTDPVLKYPKGAGHVVFETWESYIKAITAHKIFMLDKNTLKNKMIEIKPFFIDNQECDVCKLRVAPYFCLSEICLKYYCTQCWSAHSSIGSATSHRPFYKEAATPFLC